MVKKCHCSSDLRPLVIIWGLERLFLLEWEKLQASVKHRVKHTVTCNFIYLKKIWNAAWTEAGSSIALNSPHLLLKLQSIHKALSLLLYCLFTDFYLQFTHNTISIWQANPCLVIIIVILPCITVPQGELLPPHSHHQMLLCHKKV